ncbi:hypothetical protein DPMN_068033 [Dreissena polymorpha]|uniref:Uncharacterized protein n=1 Tax=Dreissena polymorpha TaxID=45954 RepID=A0A9D3YWD1_DREPO|nr:hypothetical protein DPMN_068033 [Dreissena polymorpha]
MSWKPLVAAVALKASNSLGFLRRNLPCLPPCLKARTFTNFVTLSGFAATARGPSQTNIHDAT